MTTEAIISWNPNEYRYDLHIDGKLKAYSDGHASTKDAHQAGKEYLEELAKEKGYTVVTQI